MSGNSRNLYSIRDLWLFTRFVGESEPAYTNIGSYRRALNELSMRKKTPDDVHKILDELKTPLGQWTKSVCISESSAQKIAEAFPGRRKEFTPSAGYQSFCRTTNSSGPDVNGPRLYSRTRVSQLTGLTGAQLIKLDEDRFVVPRRQGKAVGYTWRQLLVLFAFQKIRAPRSIKAAIIRDGLGDLQDESRDFDGMYLAAYGSIVDWIHRDSVADWIIGVTSRFLQGEPVNLISYDDMVFRLNDLDSMLGAA